MNRRQFLSLGFLACSCGCASGAPRVPIKRDFIPDGKFGRQIKIPLRPTFITVHSTGSPGGTAATHARLLREGQIRATSKWNTRGFNIWHFTVDDREAIQHMPLDEAGSHADHDGPGNASSLGIEMCEFREPARQQKTLDRAAELIANLRGQFRIGMDNVVPHYFWVMHRFNNWHKPCPAILMDNGKPGAKWDAFRNRISKA